MTGTTDGFQIAEADLKLRGTGDFLGTRQSGDDKYISLMLAYPDKYALAKKAAAHLLDSGEKCIFLQNLFAEHICDDDDIIEL
jgi:ATP-dependent DNA helicase RecG